MMKKNLWITLAVLAIAGAASFWYFGKPADAPAPPGGGRRGADGGGRPMSVL